MSSTTALRCQQDTGTCGQEVRVLSAHRTSEGIVRYVRCACGGIRLVMQQRTFAAPRADGERQLSHA